MESNLEELEDKLHNYAANWPNRKIEILPRDMVDIIKIYKDKIKVLENRLVVNDKENKRTQDIYNQLIDRERDNLEA